MRQPLVIIKMMPKFLTYHFVYIKLARIISDPSSYMIINEMVMLIDRIYCADR